MSRFIASTKARLASVRYTLAVAAAFVVGLAIAFVAFQEDVLSPATYGSIWVDSPEIYTRERLVNDRFLQDAWLTRQLDWIERNEASGIMSTSDVQRSLKIQANTAAPRQQAAAKEGGAKEPPTKNGAAKDGAEAPESKSSFQPWQSPRDRLVDLVDSRDQIRNLLIENQLDDRHDLSGNALYRLKFDTTVVPGRKTRAQAEVHVFLRGPVAPAEKDLPGSGAWPEDSPWRTVYVKWLDSLSTRLNQTHKELKQVYLSNEFSHNDYAKFIDFLGTNRDVVAKNLRSCPGPLMEIRAQSDKLVQLKPEDHYARKKCVNAVLEESFDADMRNEKAAGKAGVSGSYLTHAAAGPKSELPLPVDKLSPANMQKQKAADKARVSGSSLPKSDAGPKSELPLPVDKLSLANRRAQAVARDLDRWLNAFFANKAVQLVLGIVVPESAFAGNIYVNIPALAPLTNLTFFNPEFKAQDGNVFNVAQRLFVVAAINPQEMSEAAFEKLSTDPASALYGRKYDDFKSVAGVSQGNLLISQANHRTIVDEDVFIESLRFKEDPRVKGLYRAVAEVGLTNFVRRARKNTHAFTYAVTPKENSDTTLTSQMIEYDFSGSLQPPSGGDQELRGNLHKRAAATAINRQGQVVGFGSLLGGESAAVFGWVIGPRRLIRAGDRLMRVHSPAQYSMSALVSIPSWWDTVHLEVTTSWIDEDGSRRNDRPVKYTVEVPTDFEPLEATLLQAQQLGPELMESRLDAVQLTACQSGAIVIPGRRLWRSTVVTLGYQTADEISVLPNMKGIIAKFKVVQNQISQREYFDSKARQKTHQGPPEIQRAVRVWTSQGAIALPIPARIGIPENCPSDEKRK